MFKVKTSSNLSMRRIFIFTEVSQKIKHSGRSLLTKRGVKWVSGLKRISELEYQKRKSFQSITLVSQSVSQLVSQSISQLVSRSVGHFVSQSESEGKEDLQRATPLKSTKYYLTILLSMYILHSKWVFFYFSSKKYLLKKNINKL